MNDQAILVAAEIEYHPIVADEVDCLAELPLYFGGTFPLCLGGYGQPCTKRTFGVRVSLPELSQRPPRDHLHEGTLARHHFGDNARCQTAIVKPPAPCAACGLRPPARHALPAAP